MNRNTSIRFTRLGIAIIVLTGLLITLFVNVAPTLGQQTSDRITVTPLTGLITTEAGGSTAFTIVLNSAPLADVTIALSSSDTTEGTISPTNLTFTVDNWNTPQTVAVTGVDDLIDDDNIAYQIVTALAVSSDLSFNGQDASDVSATNIDDDTAGITVSTISGPTSEAGTSATFTIVLTSQPTENVTIGLSGVDLTEGTLSTASLSFPPGSWNTPQTVTVTGVDDPVDDGDIIFTILTTAISGDAVYNNIQVADVSVTNLDNDVAGITVSTISGPTSEGGTQATFTVVLNTQPAGNVTIGLSSSDTTEGTVSPTSLTFTNASWAVTQTVTVTGVDDDIIDGNIGYTIVTAAAVSPDGLYNGLNPADVAVTNNDNDTAGFTFSATTGLVTTEVGGTATFTIRLTSQPSANVTINLTSNDTTEGTVLPASLTFTNANWASTQTVTVTGVDDSNADGNIAYTIITAPATSTDASYSGVNAADVSVTNTDNDAVGITVSPISRPTTEAGVTATFTVVLTSQPTAPVTIGVVSNDLTEGTAAPASLVFTTGNWNTPQTVTVTGVDDQVADGNIPYLIVTAQAVSGDPLYNAINPADVAVTNTDNDVAGITVAPTTGLTTTEPSGTTTFTIVLTSQPSGNVTIGLSSSDNTEGTVAPASLIFTNANWNVPQTATITVVDDQEADGPILYQIVTAQAVSTDALYAAINPANVSVTNQDNDVAGIIVNPISGLNTSEAAGGTATFTVVLTSRPRGIETVTIGLSSSDTTEGTVLPASLVFTNANWSVAQIVTVTGVDDLIADGPVTYTINTAEAFSGDLNYSGKNAADVTVINQDNDTAGFTVNPTSGLLTTETGGTATFTVVLNTQPLNNVIITLSSSVPGEATVSPASLTFTTTNWNVAQTVTVTGVADNKDDGDKPFSIVTANASSTDTVYNNRNVSDVTGINQNKDFRPVAVNDSYQTNAKPDQPFNKTAPGVLSNDTDANKDPLTAILVDGPTKGELTLSANGSFVYTPNAIFETVGTDSFTYQAKDGNDLSLDPARVDIVIDPVAPTVDWSDPFSNGGIYHVHEDDPFMMLSVSASDEDFISQVRFLRWDAVKLIWVDIGVVKNSPYQWNLETGSLNFFWNQIFVFASDRAGNTSNQFIWLYRDLPFRLYMPQVAH